MGAGESSPAEPAGSDAGLQRVDEPPTAWITADSARVSGPSAADVGDSLAAALRVNTNLTRKVKPVESPHEKAARKARESAERAKARLDRARERQRFRSPGPPTAGSSSGSHSRSGTSPSRSRYLSEGSDSEEGSGREPVFVDGLTTIQSAMDSEGYQRKVNNSLREAREKINLMWARQGCKGHQVDSFYDMKEEQDIRLSERALLGKIRSADTAVTHVKDYRNFQEGSFWDSHRDGGDRVQVTKSAGRANGYQKQDKRVQRYIQNISANDVLQRAQDMDADYSAQLAIRRHEDVEDGPPPNSWGAPHARPPQVVSQARFQGFQ